MGIDPELKVVRQGMEKFLLRKSFKVNYQKNYYGEEKMAFQMVFLKMIDHGMK